MPLQFLEFKTNILIYYIFSLSTDILDIQNLSAFSADESDLSDYHEMRGPDFKRMDLGLDLLLANTNGNTLDSNFLSPKTPSPTAVLFRTPLKVRARHSEAATTSRFSFDQVGRVPITTKSNSSTTINTVTQTASVAPTAASSTITSVPKPKPKTSSPRKDSPGRSLDAMLKDVDDMFSDLSLTDPATAKVAKANNYSHPSIKEQVDEMFGSIDGGHEDAVTTKINSSTAQETGIKSTTFVAPNQPSIDDDLNKTQELGPKTPPSSPATLQVTPESKSNYGIGTPLCTPQSIKYKPSPAATPRTATLPRPTNVSF